jgi:hypothetical protein
MIGVQDYLSCLFLKTSKFPSRIGERIFIDEPFLARSAVRRALHNAPISAATEKRPFDIAIGDRDGTGHPGYSWIGCAGDSVS